MTNRILNKIKKRDFLLCININKISRHYSSIHYTSTVNVINKSIGMRIKIIEIRDYFSQIRHSFLRFYVINLSNTTLFIKSTQMYNETV